jgi:hypothetical protein
MTTKLIAAALMAGAMMVGPALATDITVGGAAVHYGQDKYGNITISLRADQAPAASGFLPRALPNPRPSLGLRPVHDARWDFGATEVVSRRRLSRRKRCRLPRRLP